MNVSVQIIERLLMDAYSNMKEFLKKERKDGTDYSNQDLLKRSYVKKNRALRNYSIITAGFGSILSIVTLFFIIQFQRDPNTLATIHIFIIDAILLICFVTLLERVLAIGEEYVIIKYQLKKDYPNLKKRQKKIHNQQENLQLKEGNRLLGLLNKIFNALEEFPYVKNFKGRKKHILKVLGWVFLGFLFALSTVVRIQVLEGIPSPKDHEWMIYFGFFIFVLAVGSFLLHLTAKTNPFKIFKLACVGVIIMIWVPAIVDRIVIPSAMPYEYILWEDYLKAFTTFFLHPDIYGNYSGVGHTVMTTLIMLFMGIYVITRRIQFSSQYKSKIKILFISVRASLCAFLLYWVVVFSGVSAEFFNLYSTLVPSISFEWMHFLLYDFYFYPLFLYLFFELFYKSNTKTSEVLYRSPTINQDAGMKLKHKNFLPEEIKTRQLSRRIKIGILIGSILLYNIVKILVLWVII